jgi:hypothetical protein
MKRIILAALAAFMILAFTGCGDGGNNPPPLFSTKILSDPLYDGDLQKDPVTGVIIKNQGNLPSVFAGIDPVSLVEFRAFLNFPLTGPTGVPGNAIIESAFLDIFINSIATQRLSDTIPLRIDLVSFQPPNLIGTNFDRTLQPEDFDTILQPALATVTVFPPISQADSGRLVTVDVTPLMVVAQRRGELDFQIRIMEDLGIVTPGLIRINDIAIAPALRVTYF